MISDNVSPEVRQLVYLVVKSIIEKTKGNLKTAIAFKQAYKEACMSEPNNKYDYSNLETRQHVRDILLRNGYIFVNPNDAEAIFATKKAIDQYEAIDEDDR